jgi:hypothetical protein
MPIFKIDLQMDDYTGKHLVINCRTKDVFACDTLEEAQALADAHQAETVHLNKG